MQMTTSIREAEIQDIPQIINLLRELGYNLEDTKDFRTSWDNIVQSPQMGILVAVTENKISGYLAYSLKPQLRLTGFSMEIDELSVSSSFRNYGIGSKLIEKVKNIAKENSIKRIILATNRDRESYMRGFYQKNGFIEKNSAWMKLDL